MRILQILPELNVGGVETGTIDFARYLKARGIYNVVVSHGGKLVPELEKMGVRHYELPVHRKSLFSFFPCIGALRKIIVKERIQIVHARSRMPAWIAYFACQNTPAELITTCHGFYGKHFFSRIMGWPKLVIVPSRIIGRHMRENFRVPPENIRCVPRGVDLARFRVRKKEEQGKSRYVIASIGRLTPLKGHVYFLKAMATVVRSIPFVDIWIIGDAPPKRESYRHELETLVKHLGLTNNVSFLGNRQDVPQLLAQTDVLVLSSVKPESFGRVITEAQAVGVPVVATHVGGFAEVIEHEKTGLLVFPKDTDAMAQAVVRLLNDRKSARQMVQAARDKLETEYTVEKMAERTVAVYRELLRSLNILVVKIGSLGDVILVTPSLKALREKFPRARICLLIGKESRKILQRCPYVDEMIIIDPRHREKGFWSLVRFSGRLRPYHFDKVVDFQNNNKSHWLIFLSFPKESYGFRNRKWGWLLSRGVRLPRQELPPVEHQFRILKALDIAYPPDARLELWLSARDTRRAQALLDSEWISERMKIVGVHIGASARWKTKNWPLEYITRLCDLLAMQNVRVVLTGTSQDRVAAERLRRMTKTPPILLVGKTDLMELAAVIKRCDVLITPDSSPMHIAAAVGTPLIAFFGPTSSHRHLPPTDRAVIFEKKPACAPCYSPRCRVRDHRCMRDISPEEVVKAVLQWTQTTP